MIHIVPEKGYTNWRSWVEGTLKRFDDNSKIICVEGPPAIGKTAVAKYLAEELEMLHLPMPTLDYFYINHYGFDLRSLDSKAPKACESCDEKRFRNVCTKTNTLVTSSQKLQLVQFVSIVL